MIPLGKLKVLVVDDNGFNLSLITAALKDEYKVMVATRGNEALKIALATRPNLILLDIMMPDISGHEVCTRLKNNEHTRDIPVVFITSMDSDADRSKGLELGAIGYINKPFRTDTVLSCVREHVAKPATAAPG